MRYRLAALLLFALLSVMSLLVGPAPAPAILDIESPLKGIDLVAESDPEPYGILDIGPPSKGKTAEEYRQQQIAGKTRIDVLYGVWSTPAVRKLPQVATLQNPRLWLMQNLRITSEEGGRLLRFTFGTGSRDEQATIINAFLRATVSSRKRFIKLDEKNLRWFVENIPQTAARLKTELDPIRRKEMQKGLEYGKATEAEFRDHIARLKQYVVIKWAK